MTPIDPLHWLAITRVEMEAARPNYDMLVKLNRMLTDEVARLLAENERLKAAMRSEWNEAGEHLAFAAKPSRCNVELGVCPKEKRMNFRQAWVDGEIEAGTLLDEIERLQAELTAPILPLVADTFAARDVLIERRRQVEDEGWEPEHDEEHYSGDLAAAAASYAVAAAYAVAPGSPSDPHTADDPPEMWPPEWDFKPDTPRRMLVKAGALILAEIERLDRMTPNAPHEGPGGFSPGPLDAVVGPKTGDERENKLAR